MENSEADLVRRKQIRLPKRTSGSAVMAIQNAGGRGTAVSVSWKYPVPCPAVPAWESPSISRKYPPLAGSSPETVGRTRSGLSEVRLCWLGVRRLSMLVEALPPTLAVRLVPVARTRACIWYWTGAEKVRKG